MTNPFAAPTPPPLPQPLPEPLPEPLAYHRMARVSARHRWWRPLVGTLFVIVAYAYAFALGLVFGLSSV